MREYKTRDSAQTIMRYLEGVDGDSADDGSGIGLIRGTARGKPQAADNWIPGYVAILG